MNRRMAASGLIALAVVAAPAAGRHASRPASARTFVKVPCSDAALTAEMAAAAPGETLSLAPRCAYVLTAALPPIAADLAILGHGATLTAGDAGFTMLTVTSGNVFVSGLSFRDGGAARSTAGSSSLIGGAIRNQGGSLTVTGGLFTGNGAGFGGAIENDFAASLTVLGATFIGNAAGYGGAIDNEGTGVFRQDTFIGNSAANWGGAVMTDFQGTLTDCAFIRNKAFIGGGVFSSFTSSVVGADFRGNAAAFNGGGIFNDNIMTIGGGRLSANSAAFEGGGVYNDIFGQARMSAMSMLSDKAGFGGGGIYNENVLNLAGSMLKSNLANFGAAIYNDWALAVANSAIVNNTASAAGGGGGIFNGNARGPGGATSLLGGTLVAFNLPNNCTGCRRGGAGALSAHGALFRGVPGHPGLRFAAIGVAAAVAAAIRSGHWHG